MYLGQTDSRRSRRVGPGHCKVEVMDRRLHGGALRAACTTAAVVSWYSSKSFSTYKTCWR